MYISVIWTQFFLDWICISTMEQNPYCSEVFVVELLCEHPQTFAVFFCDKSPWLGFISGSKFVRFVVN